jgi:hypothetical protein
MAGHELIDRHLEALAARLPRPVADELADGLTAGYQDRLERLGDPHTAARAALSDFGDIDTITTAFIRASPGRGTALRLLATGPLVGITWATTLILGHAWTWPIPLTARALLGTLLALVVLTLVIATRTRHRYQTARLAALTGVSALMIADIAMLAAITALLPQPTWLVLPALTASVTRTVLLARALPALWRPYPL